MEMVAQQCCKDDQQSLWLHLKVAMHETTQKLPISQSTNVHIAIIHPYSLCLTFTSDHSSPRIQMGALGHMLTPFCFVVCHYQVHVFKVSFDNVHPVLPWSSRLSLIACQFPLCSLAGCPGVIHPQDMSQPSQSLAFNKNKHREKTA